MRKADCRAFLTDIKPFVKISAFCKLLDISPSTVSLFMKSENNDYMISEERINDLVNLIVSTFGEIFG